MKIWRQTYTPAEVARILGVHKSTIYRYIEEGRLPALRRFGKPIRIPIEQFHQEFPEIPLPTQR